MTDKPEQVKVIGIKKSKKVKRNYFEGKFSPLPEPPVKDGDPLTREERLANAKKTQAEFVDILKNDKLVAKTLANLPADEAKKVAKLYLDLFKTRVAQITSDSLKYKIRKAKDVPRENLSPSKALEAETKVRSSKTFQAYEQGRREALNEIHELINNSNPKTLVDNLQKSLKIAKYKNVRSKEGTTSLDDLSEKGAENVLEKKRQETIAELGYDPGEDLTGVNDLDRREEEPYPREPEYLSDETGVRERSVLRETPSRLKGGVPIDIDTPPEKPINPGEITAEMMGITPSEMAVLDERFSIYKELAGVQRQNFDHFVTKVNWAGVAANNWTDVLDASETADKIFKTHESILDARMNYIARVNKLDLNKKQLENLRIRYSIGGTGKGQLKTTRKGVKYTQSEKKFSLEAGFNIKMPVEDMVKTVLDTFDERLNIEAGKGQVEKIAASQARDSFLSFVSKENDNSPIARALNKLIDFDKIGQPISNSKSINAAYIASSKLSSENKLLFKRYVEHTHGCAI
jgi:hypothetical protein